jgi:hypothetical protein
MGYADKKVNTTGKILKILKNEIEKEKRVPEIYIN